jgi:hypothetical protein
LHYQRADGLTWDDAAERVVILDADGSTIITLNPVGSLLWKQLDGERTRDDLVAHLSAVFPDVPEAQLSQDVQDFIDQLAEEGLLRLSA